MWAKLDMRILQRLALNSGDNNRENSRYVGTVKRWSRPLNRGFICNYFLPLRRDFDYRTLKRGWLINRWLLNGGSTVVTLAECHTRTAAQRLSFGGTKLKKLAENFTAMLRKLAESFTQKYTQTTQKWHKKDVWRERGQAIKALDLQFGRPKFKSSPNCWPDMFTGVRSSNLPSRL